MSGQSGGHTPGPWHWEPSRERAECNLVGGDGTVIYSALGVNGRDEDDYLVAVAPELLAAAIALANEHDALHGDCPCEGDPACAACRLRAVIEKATGAQP